MSQPTFYYFNGRGKGEVVRLLLTFAGVSFKDVRVENIDDALRARLPFGQIPFFEDNEIELAQSGSIIRYVAQKYKIAGDNNVDIAHGDAIIESIWDVLTPYWQTKDNEEKFNKYKTETIPKFLTRWEELLLKNGGKQFVGKSLTSADIAVFHAIDHLNFLKVYQLETTKYPTLSALYTTVSEVPALKTYLAARATDSKF
ncbi:hypothetical protein DFA_02259 [Cavenderia fasciculata]|uniref:Glutathione S-transferase n=1 Tax=Cavenderia fasciculata TaxID=261658 RepID=F4PYY7_CACFS|nr:uncharacterized protein DFA_02259 [Cavenderia fasciculata]EGG19016.1 hypothetical protein DFA_02259 [Cavenderia fasciculata]|eukprot:XP_004366649.1 hypothetical protein DFA_02259 [Cavenderia fasciculata]